MPSLPSPGNIIRAGFQMGIGIDTKALVQLLLAFSGSNTDAKMVALAAGLATDWDETLASLSPEQVTLEGVECTDLSSDTAPRGFQAVDYAGTRSGGMTGGICTVLSAEIARRYRGGHPRSYWPCGGSSDLTDGQEWSSDYLTAAATAFGDFYSNISGVFPSGLTYLGPVNVSFFEGFTNHTYPSGRVRAIPVVRGTPLVDPIGSYIVRPYIGSQRRRLKVRQLDT